MKRQTYLFATLLSLFLLGVFLVLRPEPTQAQAFQLFPGENPSGDFRNYVLSFYTFSIAAGTLIATVLIMIGGMIWVTSAGNPSRIELAKSYIIDSIIGVVLLMSAVVLLRLINPALVELPKITPASLGGPSGACIYNDAKQSYPRCETNVEIICRDSLNGRWQTGKTCDEACPLKVGGQPGECTDPSAVQFDRFQNIQSCIGGNTSNPSTFQETDCTQINDFFRKQGQPTTNDAQVKAIHDWITCSGKTKPYRVTNDTESEDALRDCATFCNPCANTTTWNPPILTCNCG